MDCVASPNVVFAFFLSFISKSRDPGVQSLVQVTPRLKPRTELTKAKLEPSVDFLGTPSGPVSIRLPRVSVIGPVPRYLAQNMTGAPACFKLTTSTARNKITVTLN